MSVKTVSVNEYVDNLLGNRQSISSSEINLRCDFDYVMSIMILAEYDDETSPYDIVFLDGQVGSGNYCIPNMIISRI